jgi:hypothetical protein
MNQRRRLQRLPPRLPRELRRRQPPQLVVDERQQPARRVGVLFTRRIARRIYAVIDVVHKLRPATAAA